MKISVEITFAPPDENYKHKIKNLILKIRKSGFKYNEFPLSTHIYGEYSSLMFFLTNLLKKVLKK